MRNNTLQSFLILREWILDCIGTRDEVKTYLGHGDYDTERGWFVGNVWYSYDYPIPDDLRSICRDAFGKDAYMEVTYL